MLSLQRAFSSSDDARTAVLTIQTIYSNIATLIKLQKDLFYNANGFFLPYVLLMIAALLLLKSISIIKQTQGYFSAIAFMFFTTVFYAAIFSPHVLTSQIWLAPRTMVPFFSVFTHFFIVIFSGISHRKSNVFFTTMLLLLLLCNIYMVHTIGTNHFISNRMDENQAQLIQKYIEKYEHENHIQITNIGTTFDAQPSYSYPEVDFAKYDINTKCYCVEWGDVNALNYYNHKQYEKVEFEYSHIPFLPSEVDWDMFYPDEQLFFVEDTLYWIKY